MKNAFARISLGATAAAFTLSIYFLLGFGMFSAAHVGVDSAENYIVGQALGRE